MPGSPNLPQKARRRYQAPQPPGTAPLVRASVHRERTRLDNSRRESAGDRGRAENARVDVKQIHDSNSSLLGTRDGRLMCSQT